MRALRTTLAAAWFAGLAPAMTLAADIPPIDKLLRFQPISKGVDYEIPTDPAAIAACKVEVIPNAKGGTAGWALRDGQGKVLRRFVDTRGKNLLDQWSYFQDGFEVYRESDFNDDQSPDEVRWMNAAGTRVAKVSKGKITAWTRISAEEASKVFVQALVAGDLDLLETVMATVADLESLGIPKSEVDQVATAEKTRATATKTLRAGLIGWDAETVWLRLDAALPHLIPADAGLKDDLVLHENAIIFAGPANGSGAAGKTAFLQVGEMIKVGDNWKFVDLPRVIDPKTGMITAFDGGIRSAIFRGDSNPTTSAENPLIAAAMADLAAYDKANEALLASNAQGLARFHVGRIAPLNKVVKAAEAAGDSKVELDHQKLIVDSLAAAYSSGAYAEGPKLLAKMAAKEGKIGSYAAYKEIEAEYALQSVADAANAMTVQEAVHTKLKAFIEKYPQSEETPQALLFLASTNEMNSRETEARKFYVQLAERSPTTEWGKKAVGALKRLDLVGKSLVLKGTDLKGQPIDLATYRGKTVLVTFWATWAAPAKNDLPNLAKLYAKYKAKGFEVISVNLDNEKSDLDAFLKDNPLAWPEIFEPGGMENRLATEFGVISLPTMFLIEPDGKVSNRNITASGVEIALDKMYSKTEGVALKPRAN